MNFCAGHNKMNSDEFISLKFNDLPYYRKLTRIAPIRVNFLRDNFMER